jgi:hypothetical protein
MVSEVLFHDQLAYLFFSLLQGSLPGGERLLVSWWPGSKERERKRDKREISFNTFPQGPTSFRKTTF